MAEDTWHLGTVLRNDLSADGTAEDGWPQVPSRQMIDRHRRVKRNAG